MQRQLCFNVFDPTPDHFHLSPVPAVAVVVVVAAAVADYVHFRHSLILNGQSKQKPVSLFSPVFVASLFFGSANLVVFSRG